jgi:small GTP-binding protein
MSKALCSIEVFKILILGLDASGKTTLARKIALQPHVTKYYPTIGLNFYKAHIKKKTVVLWDLAGLQQFRSLWQVFFPGADGVLFVVDSSNYDETFESVEILGNVINSLQCPIVVLVNKQDKPGALPPEVLTSLLDNPRFHVFGTSIFQENGVVKAVNYLMKLILKHRKRKAPMAAPAYAKRRRRKKAS